MNERLYCKILLALAVIMSKKIIFITVNFSGHILVLGKTRRGRTSLVQKLGIISSFW